MIYIIGGPARSGKSTLAKRVRREVDAQIVSGDAFIESLLDNLKPEWAPDIFIHSMNPVEKLPGDDAKLERIRRRDKALWSFLDGYTRHVSQVRDSVLVEGDIWPDHISGLQADHEAVFIVDTSPAEIQAKRLIAIRDSDANDNNWMENWSDERLQQWAHFNLLRSQLYVDLCQKHSHPFFDIADGGIQIAQDRAFDHLLGSEV